MTPTGLLITRPAAQAQATAAQLAGAALPVWLAPLLTISACAWELPQDAVQAVLLTSANAVPALAASALARDLPVYCVGHHTADAARRAGFTRVESAGGAADDLVALVLQRCQVAGGVLLHLCGDVVTGQLPARLSAAGFWFEARIVYQAHAASHLPADVLAALQAGQIDHVLLYSPRAAAIFARLAVGQLWPAQLTLICLSPAVARAAGPGWRGIKIASHPDEKSLLETLYAGSDTV